MPDTDDRHVHIAIAGAGLSGIGMAIALKQDGIEDFVVLERADDLGGTWRDNTYPGCACDIPSVLYSFTEEQNPGWSRAFAGQAEIQAYVQEVARPPRPATAPALWTRGAGRAPGTRSASAGRSRPRAGTSPPM